MTHEVPAGGEQETDLVRSPSPGNDRVTIATWLYAERREEASHYPQTRGRSWTSQFHATYWRCVLNYFCTARFFNPDAQLLMFSNCSEPPVVDGFEVGDLLRRLGVDCRLREYAWRPQPMRFDNWGNQFYVFDCLEELAKQALPGERIILADSDCVWLDNVQPLAKTISGWESINFDPGFSNRWRGSGIDLWEVGEVWRRWGLAWEGPARYAGGEFVGITKEGLGKLLHELQVCWPRYMKELGEGLTVPTEEAHLLSYLYARLGYQFGGANGFVRRLLTGPRTRNVTPLDQTLTLAHVPSEKQRGMVPLFRQLAPNVSLKMEEEQLKRAVARSLGIGHLSPGKVLSDIAVTLEMQLRLI